jgi:hypothetical protein
MIVAKPVMLKFDSHFKTFPARALLCIFVVLALLPGCKPKAEDEFTRLTNAGKTY